MKVLPPAIPIILFLLTFPLLSGNQAAFSTKTTVVENRVVEQVVTGFNQPTSAVIQVINRMGSQHEGQADGFSDLLTAEISDFGLKIIPPEMVTRAVSELQGKNRGQSPLNTLSDNSVKELSSMLGADCFLVATLNGFQESSVELPSLRRKVTTYKLRGSWRMHSTSDAASFLGKSFTVEKKFPITQNVSIKLSRDSILSDLIADAVGEVTKEIFQSDLLAPKGTSKYNGAGERAIPNPLALQGSTRDRVGITVEAKLQKMRMPEIVMNEQDQLVFSGNELEVIATDAEIEIDGILVGNASPDRSISIPKGIHRMTVRRAGFSSEERMINAHEGMKLTIEVQPTPQEYELWRSQLIFLENAKAGAVLTENERKIAEGMREYLKNSKFEVPEINLNKSLF
jgi:hypothetical protein